MTFRQGSGCCIYRRKCNRFHCRKDTLKEYTPTEINSAVKQLLMKYLPNEQLAKITCTRAQGISLKKRKDLVKKRPEFSFATLKYLQKYNLLRTGIDLFYSRDFSYA